MIDVSPGTEYECGAEKVNRTVNIIFDGLGKTTKNRMSKIGECCSAVCMIVGTLFEHCLKTVNGTMEMLAKVAPPKECVCITCCISVKSDFTLKFVYISSHDISR
jgi:hypothetical protein